MMYLQLGSLGSVQRTKSRIVPDRICISERSFGNRLVRVNSTAVRFEDLAIQARQDVDRGKREQMSQGEVEPFKSPGK